MNGPIQVYFDNICPIFCINHQNLPIFLSNLYQRFPKQHFFYVDNEQIKDIDYEKNNSYNTVHLHT